MSQEPSKEIKAVLDSVLGAFNSKDLKRLTTRSAVKWPSLMDSLRFAGQVRMLKRVGGPTPSDGVSNSAWQASASRLKRRFTGRWSGLAPTLSFQRRSRLD